MPRIINIVLGTLILLLLMSNLADAYVGPGAGISVLGSLLSILATIFVAIGAIIFWPVRKYLKRRKARLNAADGMQAANAGNEAAKDDNQA